MIIDFKEIRHLIPWFVFNEYGQLTGNYVHSDRIVCVAENERIKIWLDKDAYEAQDPERLICDYDERTLRGLPPDAPLENDDRVLKTEEEWKRQLTPDQFKVCRSKATEKPFTGEYYNNKDEGMYQCVCCGNNLFSSKTKYESGTGWPSFWAPVSTGNVKTAPDNSLFMRRIEVLCNKCDAHLGHLFEDGPAPTHQRYCINSVALKFVKRD